MLRVHFRTNDDFARAPAELRGFDELPMLGCFGRIDSLTSRQKLYRGATLSITCLAACAAYGTSDGHPVLDANCVRATAGAAAGVRPTTNAVNRGRASNKLTASGTPTRVRTTRPLPAG